MNPLKYIIKFIKSPKFIGPIIVIIVSLLLYKICEAVINKVTIKGKTNLEKKKRKTILLLINNIVKYLFVIIAIILILEMYGVNTTSLIAGLGIVGAVMGLAFQDALKDIISGINIIMDNYYVVGDVVRYNDFTGTVIEFGLKNTKIKNVSDEVLIISNRNIDQIVNLSQNDNIIYIKVPTAYGADSKKVSLALNNVISKIKEYDYIDKDETKYLGIDEFDSSSINYIIAVKCEKEKTYAIRREVLLLIREEYEKKHITIPFNQLEVTINDKV